MGFKLNAHVQSTQARAVSNCLNTNSLRPGLSVSTSVRNVTAQIPRYLSGIYHIVEFSSQNYTVLSEQ